MSYFCTSDLLFFLCYDIILMIEGGESIGKYPKLLV